MHVLCPLCCIVPMAIRRDLLDSANSSATTVIAWTEAAPPGPSSSRTKPADDIPNVSASDSGPRTTRQIEGMDDEAEPQSKLRRARAARRTCEEKNDVIGI